MKHLLTIFLFYYCCALAQTNHFDSTFIKEINGKAELRVYKILNGDTINRIISIDGQSHKYGKWLFFFDNGSLKSEGIFSLKGIIKCGVGSGPYKPSYSEKRIGKWSYFTEQGKPRTDLYGSEQPSQGYFRLFDDYGRLIEKGEFTDEGNLIDGEKYYYDSSTGKLIETNKYIAGKCVRKPQLNNN